MITVYTMPNCGPCFATKRALDTRGIPYRTVDLSTDPVAQARVAEWGYREAPIVEVGPDHHWSGFQIGLIAELPVPE